MASVKPSVMVEVMASSPQQQHIKSEEKKEEAKTKQLLRMCFLSARDLSVSETRQYSDSTTVTGMRLSRLLF